MERILERADCIYAVQAANIRFILREEPTGRFVLGVRSVNVVRTQIGMLREKPILRQPQLRSGAIRAPAPGISEPDVRQHVQWRPFLRAIVDGDSHEHVVDMSLAVLDEHVEIAIVREHACIE